MYTSLGLHLHIGQSLSLILLGLMTSGQTHDGGIGYRHQYLPSRISGGGSSFSPFISVFLGSCRRDPSPSPDRGQKEKLPATLPGPQYCSKMVSSKHWEMVLNAGHQALCLGRADSVPWGLESIFSQ